MKRERVKGVADKSEFNIKNYAKEFLLFLDKHIIKKSGILFVVALLIIGISLSFIVNVAKTDECVGTCRDGIRLFSEYGSKMSVLFVTAFAGIVPYMYAPIIGFIGSVINEVITLAYAIKGYGYFCGTLAYIVPMLINIIVACVVAAIGIYVCNAITVGYKISNVKNMNVINFRIKLYEGLSREKKVKELTKKRDEKLKKLEAKKEKINYLQILNTAIVVSIIQFMSVVIQHIVL